MSIRSLCLSLGLLLALCGPAVAQDEGPYLGLGAGQSKVKDPGSCSDVAAGLFSPGYSCSITDTDTGWKVFGGYQATRNVAIEASYLDLGASKLSVSGIATIPPLPATPVTVSGKISATGFSVDMILSAPITEAFSLSARAGLFAWTLKTSLTATASNGVSTASASQSDSTSGNSFDFGVGARYDFNRNVGVRVEFQRFASVGDDTTGKSDIDLISASLIYAFR
jgi:OmpA-OmpF porin, OOP family